MIQYQYDTEGLAILEKRNGNDVEFEITICDKNAYLSSFLHIRDDFNANNIHTDVIFYALSEHHYRVIARKDYYVDFILRLFKYHLIRSVAWTEGS